MSTAVTTKKSGAILLFGMFQVVLGSTLPSGLYALYEQGWGLSRFQTTLVFSAYVAGVLCSLIFLGGLADRFGRKPAILLSIALAMLSSITFLVATEISLLIVARFLSGLSVGVCTGAFTSALNDVYGRTHGSALSAVVTSAALASGPLASALLAVVLPLPLRLPFVFHVILIGIVLVGCLRLSGSSAPHGRTAATGKVSRGLFPTRAALFMFLCCASVIGWAYGANGMWQSVVPLSMRVVNSQLQAACLTALMLGVSAITQWLTLKRSPEKIILAGLPLLAVGFGITAYGIGVQQIWILVVATVFVGVGQGMSFRSSLALVAHSASPERQAAVISIYYIFGYCMTAVLPLVSNASGINPVLYFMVIVAMLSLLFARLITK